MSNRFIVFAQECGSFSGSTSVLSLPLGMPGPSESHQVRTNVLQLDGRTYRAEYHTREVGLYRVEVLHGGSPISGKPFVVEVCDPSRVKVVDIEDGIVGRSQTFRGA